MASTHERIPASKPNLVANLCVLSNCFNILSKALLLSLERYAGFF